MKRSSVVLALCLGLAIGCGGKTDETEIAEREPDVAGRGDNRPVPVTETGCLTAQGDRFVLTALERGAAQDKAPGAQESPAGTAGARPTTESYQLIGNESELRQLVGQQVRVTGEADVPKVAEVRESTPPTAASGATGTAGQPEPARPGEPQVATTTETRLEVTQLRVQSITATGQACAAR